MEEYNIDVAQIILLLKEYPKDKKYSSPFIDIAKGKFKYKKNIFRWLKK
jgi:hypothetical protein